MNGQTNKRVLHFSLQRYTIKLSLYICCYVPYKTLFVMSNQKYTEITNLEN